MTRQAEVRDFVVVGHQLRVVRIGESRWGITVDGEEFHPDCGTVYQAWAVGVAESYRRGARARRVPRDDRS